MGVSLLVERHATTVALEWPPCLPPQKMPNMNGLLSISTEIPTGEALRLIDDALLALKSQRNTFAPISSLPPEVLLEVFLIVRDNDEVPRTMSLKWVKVTHVSRHWRSVALDSPSLWTKPPLENLQWTELMLRRSKSVPLSIKADVISLPLSMHGLELSLKHRRRGMKDLTIRTTARRWWKVVKAILPKSAPDLERLKLVCLTAAPYAEICTDILCETPKLRHLELSGFDIRWNTHSHFLQALTCLKIRGVCRLWTWKQFAESLKAMPELAFLEIDNAFPRETKSGMSLDWPSTHFAFLQTMNIRYSSSTEVLVFLTCVTFPPTTKTLVECSVSPGPEFPMVLRQLSQPYSDFRDDTYFQTLLLLETPDRSPGMRLKLFTAALTDEQMLARSNMSADVDWIFTLSIRDSNKTMEIMKDVFNCDIPLRKINRMYLGERHHYVLDPQSLASTAGRFEELRSFMTAKGSAKILVDALKLSPDAESDALFGTLSFPNLSSIYFYKAKFFPSNTRLQSGRQYNPEPDLTIPNLLLNSCLVQRSTAGAGIAKLTLRNCRWLLKDDVNVLKKIVQDVDWDEEERFLYDDDFQFEDDDQAYDYGDYADVDSSDEESITDWQQEGEREGEENWHLPAEFDASAILPAGTY